MKRAEAVLVWNGRIERLRSANIRSRTSYETGLQERIAGDQGVAQHAAMWETRDPDGRGVLLRWTRWTHILRRHPYIGVEPEVILETVAQPDARMPGQETDEEWFYRRGAGPSAWIRVVVHYEDDRGLIVTAFPRRSFP